MEKPPGAGTARVRIGRGPNLRERATDTLRSAILELQFEPGDRLVERTLSEQMGVSRTCVREALHRLESVGLVGRSAGRGFVVATVSADEARQIYEVRAALEPAAARLFTERASAGELRALEQAHRRLRGVAGSDDIGQYVRALDTFYDALLVGAHNEVAREVLDVLRGRMNHLRALTARAAGKQQKARTVELLGQIVEAAARRDGAQMAELCRDFTLRSAAFAARVLCAPGPG